LCAPSSGSPGGAGTLVPGSIRRYESIAAVRFLFAIVVVDLMHRFFLPRLLSRYGHHGDGDGDGDGDGTESTYSSRLVGYVNVNVKALTDLNPSIGQSFLKLRVFIR